MRQREFKRCVCLQASGPYVACFNTPIHHLSQPTLQGRHRNGAPALISPSYTPSAISALLQRLASSLLPASPSHIHISYLDAKHVSDTHAEPSECICKIRSVLCSYLCWFALFLSAATVHTSLVFYPSLMFPAHSFPLNCPDVGPHNGPFFNMLKSLPTSSNSASLGFA